MVKAALMARFQKFIVDLPSIVSQPTLVVGSQDGSRFVKATARQNVAEGYLLAHRHPEPAQLRGHIPPGLVHAVHHTSSGGIPQSVPGGRSTPCHAVYGAGNGAAVHLQLKAVPQYRGHIGVGHRQVLFILTASANASGPNCTFAAPRASEVCRESRPCTRLWHFSQWPMSISKRRQMVLRTISC